MSKKNDQKYAIGYSDNFIAMLKRRRLKTHGQFLLPYLKPGMKILDCGCGPGSMTIDIAQYISTGEVIGIDIEDSQLEIARIDAKNAGVFNISFQNADVFKLPFADNTFDLVFSQGLLSHFTNSLDALLEQKRVAKIGGHVAARNGYVNGIAFYPSSPLLQEASLFQIEPGKSSGGDIEIGLKFGKLFQQAGLIDIKHTVFCECSDGKKIALTNAEEIFQREYNKQLLAQGKITLEQLQSFQKAWIDFANHPDSFSYCPWCEAIGAKP
jgi:SAM-dependent methyltransferase